MRDGVNGEEKIRKGWERQRTWIFLKRADPSHCFVLVTGLPSSAACTFLLDGWKFSQDVEDTEALFLNRTWWFIHLLKLGRMELVPGTSVSAQKEKKTVDVLMSLGNLRADPWIPGSWREELNWSHIRSIYQFWRRLGEAIPRQLVEMNLDNCFQS